MANNRDGKRLAAPKLQNGTSFFYFVTDQWRYEDTPVGHLASPVEGNSRYQHHGDYNVLGARLGWLPSYQHSRKMELNYIKRLLLLVQQRKKKSENMLHKN